MTSHHDDRPATSGRTSQDAAITARLDAIDRHLDEITERLDTLNANIVMLIDFLQDASSYKITWKLRGCTSRPERSSDTS